MTRFFFFFRGFESSPDSLLGSVFYDTVFYETGVINLTTALSFSLFEYYFFFFLSFDFRDSFNSLFKWTFN